MALEEVINSSGGIAKMVRTGHSFMKRELKENPDSPLAGEMSGHFFLNDRWPGFDDSLYNTARLLEIIARESSPRDGGPKFSDWFDDCNRIQRLMEVGMVNPHSFHPTKQGNLDIVKFMKPIVEKML